MIGGSTWESNPPGKFLIPPTGFEDRAAHQRLKYFRIRYLFAPHNSTLILAFLRASATKASMAPLVF